MEILNVLQFLHNFVGINIYRIVITLRIVRKIKIGTKIYSFTNKVLFLKFHFGLNLFLYSKM